MGAPSRKPDADAIGAFLDRLSRDPRLTHAQRWWAGRLFHVTDVTNAARILAGGWLLCHEELERTRLPYLSASATDIMAATDAWVHDCVRLYFRPRTPTFYRNEGLRPAGTHWHGAHCPVPVALIFDAPRVMAIEGVRWSGRNLAVQASKPWLGEDAASLADLDFASIYHDAPFPEDMDEEERHRITSARQAEVIVPGRLSTTLLSRIVLRSEADRKTLRTLLKDNGVSVASQQPMLAISGVNAELFHGRWTAIKDVQRHGESVRVQARAPFAERVSFTADVVWTGEDGIERRNLEPFPYDPATILKLPVPADLADRPARMTLRLDGALAFTGWFRPEGEFLIEPAP